MTDDLELLRQYTREHCEPAFRELVARHINLVYSAALRTCGGDSHLAEDVTQMVFMDLARKARTISRDVMLAGWLYRHTCFTAANAVRSERRRKTREQISMKMRALDDSNGPPWAQVAPHLDATLNQLSRLDRDALVLRFLKGQDLRAVGAALGVSEDAAQKRVSRALERLRALLMRRGVVTTVSGLTSLLTAEAVTAAPAGLAASAAAASLTATAGNAGTLTLLELMAITKLKIGFITVVVAGSALLPLLLQNQAQARLQEQHDAMQQQAARVRELEAENRRLSETLAQPGDSDRVSRAQFLELLQSRGEVARLRTELQEMTRPSAGATLSRAEMLAAMSNYYAQRVSELRQLLDAHPGEKIPELQFVSESDWVWLVHENLPDTEEGRRRAMSRARLMGEGNFANEFLKPAIQQYAQANPGQFPGHISQLKPYFKSGVDESILARWEVVPKSRFVPRLRAQLKEDWFVTQKAPVNAALDQRILHGLKEGHMFADGPAEFWDRVE